MSNSSSDDLYYAWRPQEFDGSASLLSQLSIPPEQRDWLNPGPARELADIACRGHSLMHELGVAIYAGLTFRQYARLHAEGWNSDPKQVLRSQALRQHYTTALLAAQATVASELDTMWADGGIESSNAAFDRMRSLSAQRLNLKSLT